MTSPSTSGRYLGEMPEQVRQWEETAPCKDLLATEIQRSSGIQLGEDLSNAQSLGPVHCISIDCLLLFVMPQGQCVKCFDSAIVTSLSGNSLWP